ncbi:MAG: glutathione S-transferase family protein [bacterium]
MRLYDFADSGNGYKVRLLLAQLGRPYQLVEKDILRGETREVEFLAINPNGRVPVLETGEGAYLPESNAILYYLAQGSPLLPENPLQRAQVLQWMFFEQYSHEPNLATSRFWLRHTKIDAQRRAALAAKHTAGLAALAVMETHLAERDFFVGGRYSIADIALYAYTHVADQGGFDLTGFAGLQQWLARVAAQPGYVAMHP